MSRARPVAAIVAAVATVLLAVGTLGPAVAAADTAPNVVVVDDDGLQCPQSDTDSVQEALDMVRDGGRVRVCPGRYAEQLTITRTVHLQGEIGAVASLDCLDPSASALDDLDATRFAILEPDPDTGVEPATHVRIAADGVELAGFVVQGLEDTSPQQPGPLYDAAISVSDAWARTRLHHNLFRLNTLGVELGASDSRVDHNCFRDNGWALANQRYVLRGARIDDNETTGTEFITWEIGWSYRPTEDVLLDHNVSHEEGFYVAYIDHSTRARFITNDIHTTGQGIRINPENVGVEVRGNSVTGGGVGRGLAGVFVTTPGARRPTTGLVIADNDLSAMGGSVGRGISLRLDAQPTGAVITGNTVRDNALEGLAVAAGNHLSTLSGNTATGNLGNGIRVAAGATRNLLVDNVALGNNTDRGGVDARDGGLAADGVTPTSNQWIRTTCQKDVPAGAICVIP